MTAPRSTPADPGQARRLLLILLTLNALAAAAYVLLPGGMAASASMFAAPMPDIPLWQLALANMALVVVAYGAFAFAGDAMARRAGLPGALAAGSSAGALCLRPTLVGLGVGVALVALDRLTAAVTDFPGFPHPPFPGSLLASLTAGIGEEIAFRLFFLSLWALVLTAFLGWLRRPGLRPAALVAANILAALAFAAGHLGSAMALAGVASPAALPPAELAELVVLNGGLGFVAGRAFLRHGILAAAGIHFWADIVWHVLFPVLAGS